MSTKCITDWESIVNSTSQPEVIIHANNDCDGHRDTAKPGTYDRDDLEKMTSNMDNDINVMIVPPNMEVKICGDENLNKCADDRIGPGIITIESTDIDKNDISSFKVYQNGDWDDHLIDCCLSKGDKNQCGQFYGANSSGACDAIMVDYCNKNPSKDECACFNVQDENGREVPQPQCFYAPCANTNAFKLTSWEKIPCGTYCDQVLDIGGSTNTVVDSTNFVQYCGENSNNGSDNDNNGTDDTNTPNPFSLSLPDDFSITGIIDWMISNIILIASSCFSSCVICLIICFIFMFLLV